MAATNQELEVQRNMMDYGEFLVRQGNEKLREFYLQGPVNEAALSVSLHTLNYIASLSKDPIHIHLSTYGGDINAGLGIYDLIKRVKAPVDITAIGACMSMGVIILQAARHRYATRNCHFMLHQLRGMNEGNLGEQRDSYRHMEALQLALNNILAARTGKTAKQIDKLIDRKDYYISATDALKLCLIDKIVE